MAERPRVLVTRKLPDAVERRLKEGYDARLNPDDRQYGADELIRLAETADAILPCTTERLAREAIERLPASVRIIANFAVGVDHVDLAAAKARGIVVTNTPDVLNDATAEVALLLMLGAARRASEGDRLVRSGGWKSWSPAFMVGTQVTGRTIGIVGMGRIGQVMAERCRGLGMTVRYHNRRRLPAAQEMGAIYHDTLADLLPHCEVLSLHCPASEETRKLVNRETIARLPDGAIFVNTPRGALVDDDALIEALASGKLAAAGLDVFEGEPAIDPRYAETVNTFLLPHIGSATKETREAMGFRAIANLDAFFSGREPPDRVA